MRNLLIFLVLTTLAFQVNAQVDDEGPVELTDEEIEYLIEEEGLTQEEIDAYLNNGLSEEEAAAIDSALVAFREEYNEESLQELLNGIGDFEFENLTELTPEDIDRLLQESDAVINNLQLTDYTGLDLKATQTKESFLTFLKNNSQFVIRNAELIVIIHAVVDLVNGNANLLEILKDELLPTIAPSGNIYQTLYDREMGFDNLIFEDRLPRAQLERLENTFNSALETNFPADVADIIKRNY
ncbi:MAG: hypothetical protein AAGA43_15805 [Bacteroidota bacterium]